jgi:hypothetical protein
MLGGKEGYDMVESNSRAVVLDVCDILDRLGISWESIAHLIEVGKEPAKSLSDPNAQLAQSE